MFQSAHDPNENPSLDAHESAVERASSSSGYMDPAGLSPRPPNRSPSPFQTTKTTESNDSSPAKAGVKAEDLYDASPNTTFRTFSSEFTFRVDSSPLNGSARALPHEVGNQTDAVGGQNNLTDQLNALQLVGKPCETPEPSGPAGPTGQAAGEEISDAQHPAISHSSAFSIVPFRYSADAEIRPEEPFYDVDFQSSLKKVQKLARKVRDCLGECEIAWEEGSSLHNLRTEATQLSHFKCPDKRTIGVVGNSGQGKICSTKFSKITDRPLDRRRSFQTVFSGLNNSNKPYACTSSHHVMLSLFQKHITHLMYRQKQSDQRPA
jgi:hypothetical protein